MKSQTALVARKCRLNEWARMVHDCKNRPAGMSVDEWCELNSITKANYYYRMKQVRIACLDALPSEESEHAVVPVPLEIMEESTSVSTVSSNNTSYLELYAHGVTLRVTEAASETLLAKVLGVLAHVE